MPNPLPPLSAVIRARVAAKTGGKCWLCLVEGKYTAHLIDRMDPQLLELYVKTGIPVTRDVDSTDNLVYLCGTCHDCFDLRAPAWVFLPCPLEPHLVAEQNFQNSRRDNPRAIRKRVNRRSVLFRPYLIREGFLQHPDSIWVPRKWHGDPVLAIMRSYVILQGLPRLALEKGGLPQSVAEMYISLIGLYATPYRDPSVLDTITVQPVASAVEAVGTMGPPAKRVTSYNGSVGTSVVTGEIWHILRPRRKSSKQADSVSRIASEAPTDQTGHSNDTEQTRTVPTMPAAKRRRVDGGESASGTSRWVEGFPVKRGQHKDK